MWTQLLHASTSVTNFACLVISLWLGFYILTRSPRSKVSWLASGTVWALCGYFLSILTFMQQPLGAGTLPWWWGWSVAFAVPLWFHLSVSLLPDRLAQKQRPLVVLIYFLTLNLVAMEAYTSWVFTGMSMRPPIYNSAQRPGPLYPLFGIYLISVPALSLRNLRLGWKQAKSLSIRRQFASLLLATFLAVFSGAYAVLSTWLALDTPVLINSLSLGAGVVLLSYAVASYNALIEGRVIRRDFAYTALAIGLIVGVYLFAALLSDVVFDVPFIAFIFIIMLAIVSHSLYDRARTRLDRLFYRQQYGELRANLRDLVHTPTSDQDIQGHLQDILETFCRSLGVHRALIALREGEGFVVLASWQVNLEGQSIASDVLDRDETAVLSPPVRIAGLGNTALIVPLHAAGKQIGVIVLSERATGVRYTEDDLDLLEDLADTVAGMVHAARLQRQSMEQINRLLGEVRGREQEIRTRMRDALWAERWTLVLKGRSEKETVSLVEDALRYLYDYAYLGEHRLSHLDIVQSHLDVQEGAFVTHLDRGKALQQVLIAAIEKLKPAGSRPSLPAREWHQYVILYDCYVMGKLNRDVMSVLYISEGTFNRARRRAIRAVTRALIEIEREAQRSN